MKNSGFTLLELSIVLVIIGLIIGGITAGAELIRSAELGAIASDKNKLATSINIFKLQYNATPGDIDNAEDYWGSVTGSCTTVAGTGTQTCNGDGDGKVFYPDIALGPTIHEIWRVWEHMANAEVIPGSYSGISITGCTTTNTCGDTGNNAPDAKFNGAMWSLHYLAVGVSGWNYDNWNGKLDARHVLVLGNPSNITLNSASATLNGHFWGYALTPADMRQIDIKVDDGLPGSGAITNRNAGGTAIGNPEPDCTILSGGQLQYNLTYEDYACAAYMDIE